MLLSRRSQFNGHALERQISHVRQRAAPQRHNHVGREMKVAIADNMPVMTMAMMASISESAAVTTGNHQ
jgi:hypothetical protein